MLCKEIIAFCSQIHIKHCAQNKELLKLKPGAVVRVAATGFPGVHYITYINHSVLCMFNHTIKANMAVF